MNIDQLIQAAADEYELPVAAIKQKARVWPLPECRWLICEIAQGKIDNQEIKAALSISSSALSQNLSKIKHSLKFSSETRSRREGIIKTLKTI